MIEGRSLQSQEGLQTDGASFAACEYFQIFGLEKKYDIEDNNLEGKYKICKRNCTRTLRMPLSRGIHILKLDGVEIHEEHTISDPELLDEIMEIREEVEKATCRC
ncbi:putative co-chaperone Hsc20 [Lupinus albus]|uniref:Putative co-chaperone Hsc20 n=1 Tax=Lupinus albus TaxID=3870 RepID=A0A6A4MUA4_LUPAL|nr:putative co-chaperone Hsc20 [Lupinus albus]